MALIKFPKVFGGTPEERFWKWFEQNDDMLFDFERDRDVVFDKLASAMGKVHPDLTFEFSPVRENGTREFVISAGGIKAAFPVVETLFDAAPVLKNWLFVKYRPRRYPLNDLQYGGKSIAAEDVHYKMFKDGGKVGLVLFFDGFEEVENQVYQNMGYLFLDEALGEYDIETKVGFIEFRNRESEEFEGARPLLELPVHFDEYFAGVN